MGGAAFLRDHVRVTSRVIDTVSYEINVANYDVKIEIHGSRANWDVGAIEQVVSANINDAPNIETLAFRIVNALATAMRAVADNTMYHYIKCWVTLNRANSKQTVFIERFSTQWD